MDKSERKPSFDPEEKNALATSGWDSSPCTNLGTGNPKESQKELGLAEITTKV